MLEHLEELGETLPDTVSKDRFKVYLEVVKSLSKGKDWDISLEKQEAVFALYKKNQDRDFGKKAVIKSLVEHLESLLGPVKLEKSSSGSKMTSYNYSCMGIIDAFDGDNFSCFLKKFEAVVSLVPADGSDIDSKVKAKLLVSKLSPSVIERLLKFSNVDLDDYKQLIGALKDLYREKVMSTVTVRMKLTSLKRGDFRSIEEYGKEIIKLAELLYSDSKTEERDKMVTGELCAKFGPSYLTACENNAQWIPEEVLEMIVAREKRHNFGMNSEKRRPMNNREGRNDVRKCWNCGEEGHERRNCNANVTSNASMEVRSSNKVYIKGQLVGNSKVCFVDSGADGSLMDYDTYLELMTWGIEMTPCESLIYWGDICEVNRIRILGIVNVGMKFNEKGKLFPFEFNVVENSEVMKSLKCNMVIGGDNLSKYEYVQNLKQRFVSIDGERINLLRYQGSDKMVNVSMGNDLNALNVTLNVFSERNSSTVKDKFWKELPLLKVKNREERCTFECPKISFEADCAPPKFTGGFINAEKQQCIEEHTDGLTEQKVLIPGDFSVMAAYLTDQLENKAKVIETLELSKAFDNSKSLVLKCDASCSDVGSMLPQNFLVNDEWKLLPIAFWSKGMQSSRSCLSADYLSRGDENDGCSTMCAITKREVLMFMVKSFLKDGKKKKVNPFDKRLADNLILEPDETMCWKINLINRPAFKVPWILLRERLSLMKERHMQGHFSADNGIASLKQLKFWIFMYLDYKNCIGTCMICQKEIVHKLAKLKSHVVKETSRLFEMINLDLCGPLSCTVNENLHLLNIVDDFTCFWLCFPGNSTLTTSVLEKFILVISMFSSLDKIRMNDADEIS